MYETFIEDGYTYDGLINPEPGLHDGLTFKYRPILPPDRAVIISEIDSTLASGAARRAETLAGAACIRQLVSWDLTRLDGSQVEISVDNVLRVQPGAFGRLFKICMGGAPSDLPESSPVTGVESELAVIMNETTPIKN